MFYAAEMAAEWIDFAVASSCAKWVVAGVATSE